MNTGLTRVLSHLQCRNISPKRSVTTFIRLFLHTTDSGHCALLMDQLCTSDDRLIICPTWDQSVVCVNIASVLVLPLLVEVCLECQFSMCSRQYVS